MKPCKADGLALFHLLHQRDLSYRPRCNCKPLTTPSCEEKRVDRAVSPEGDTFLPSLFFTITKDRALFYLFFYINDNSTILTRQHPPVKLMTWSLLLPRLV